MAKKNHGGFVDKETLLKGTGGALAGGAVTLTGASVVEGAQTNEVASEAAFKTAQSASGLKLLALDDKVHDAWTRYGNLLGHENDTYSFVKQSDLDTALKNAQHMDQLDANQRAVFDNDIRHSLQNAINNATKAHDTHAVGLLQQELDRFSGVHFIPGTNIAQCGDMPYHVKIENQFLHDQQAAVQAAQSHVGNVFENIKAGFQASGAHIRDAAQTLTTNAGEALQHLGQTAHDNPWVTGFTAVGTAAGAVAGVVVTGVGKDKDNKKPKSNKAHQQETFADRLVKDREAAKARLDKEGLPTHTRHT